MMWWSKKIKELEAKIESIEFIVGRQKVCSVCGCIIPSYIAVEGKSEIRTKMVWLPYPLSRPSYEEYIYHPYYCKIHAPKEEEKEENKSLDK